MGCRLIRSPRRRGRAARAGCEALPEWLTYRGDLVDDPMDGFERGKSAPKVALGQVAGTTRSIEERREAVKAPGIGHRVEYSFENSLIIRQDVAQRPRRLEI